MHFTWPRTVYLPACHAMGLSFIPPFSCVLYVLLPALPSSAICPACFASLPNLPALHAPRTSTCLTAYVRYCPVVHYRTVQLYLVIPSYPQFPTCVCLQDSAVIPCYTFISQCLTCVWYYCIVRKISSQSHICTEIKIILAPYAFMF